MADRYLSAIGGYLPLLRFDRMSATRALRFAGLGGRGAGLRALAGWDEDALTLAVEAARSLATSTPDRLVFASTSAAFFDRSQAVLAAEALGFPPTVRTSDVGGTRRCAVSALLDVFLGSGDTIVVAGEARAARAGSVQHAGFGDGGAAVRVGSSGGARLIGHASNSRDLLDFYSSRDLPTGYAAEERFVRDTAGQDIIVPAILAACEHAGVAPDRIAHAAVHEPLAGMWRGIAGAVGTKAANHAATLEGQAGDLGAAHALFALALALDAAQPGDIVLLAGFGSGCDVLLLEVTGPVAGAPAVTAAVSNGLRTDDYARFLSLTGAVALDWGVRAETEQKAQPTVLARHGRDTMGFVGGRDAAGNVQFPKSNIPVRPDAAGPEDLSDVRLADCSATLVSVTADRLNFTPDPPFWFGLVQFDNGARVLMELTDADAAGFKVGDALAMRFRIKSIDRRRGLRTYFWKAAPASRPALEG